MTGPHHLSSARHISPPFHSTNLDQIRDYVSREIAPHSIVVSKGAQPNAKVSTLALRNMNIVDISYGTDVSIAPADLVDCLLIHIAVSGRSVFDFGVEQSLIEPGSLHILSCGRAPTIRMTSECRHLGVRIPISSVYRQLGELVDAPIRKPLIFDRVGEKEAPFTRLWSQLLMHIVGQFDAGFGMNPIVSEHYEATLISLLLNMHHSNYSDLICRNNSNVCPAHIKRARDIIESNLDDTLVVGDLARALHVSVRSLQNGFKQFLGVTPVEYIRFCRLKRVHAALSEADPETVTDVMSNFGINNFGRYAQYYRQQFGYLPSQTPRRKSTH